MTPIDERRRGRSRWRCSGVRVCGQRVCWSRSRRRSILAGCAGQPGAAAVVDGTAIPTSDVAGRADRAGAVLPGRRRRRTCWPSWSRSRRSSSWPRRRASGSPTRTPRRCSTRWSQQKVDGRDRRRSPSRRWRWPGTRSPTRNLQGLPDAADVGDEIDTPAARARRRGQPAVRLAGGRQPGRRPHARAVDGQADGRRPPTDGADARRRRRRPPRSDRGGLPARAGARHGPAALAGRLPVGRPADARVARAVRARGGLRAGGGDRDGRPRRACARSSGDLLLQVVFHARIATEHPTDPFDVDDVAADLVAKLVRRHPHVFEDAPLEGDVHVAVGPAEERREAARRRRSTACRWRWVRWRARRRSPAARAAPGWRRDAPGRRTALGGAAARARAGGARRRPRRGGRAAPDGAAWERDLRAAERPPGPDERFERSSEGRKESACREPVEPVACPWPP